MQKIYSSLDLRSKNLVSILVLAKYMEDAKTNTSFLTIY